MLGWAVCQIISANGWRLCDGAAIANRQLSFAPKLNRITEVANMYFTRTIAKPPVGRSNKNEFQRFIYAYTIVINDMQTPSIGLIISLVLANFNFLKYAKEK